MPIGIKAVREALSAGESVMVTLVTPSVHPAGKVYTLSQSGHAIPHRTFAKLKDDLIVADQGIFADQPQSYALKAQA